MKYISEILWFASWPVLIYISYLLSVWAIKYLEKKQPEENA
jgi:hypothetical protein